MRHVRWLNLLCVLVVVAFSVLCFRVLFSVADINVEYSYYSSEEVESANELLQRYNGKNLLFVDKEEIVDLINRNTGLKVDSISKVYPNKLSIKLKERQERFAIKNGDSYIILDDEYTVVDIRQSIKNSADGLDNILLTFNNLGFDASKLSLRSTLNIGNSGLLSAFVDMISRLKSPRDFINEITVDEKEEGKNFYVTISTFEGVDIEIRKALEKPGEKISLGVAKYLELEDIDKLCGKVAVFELDSGELVANYTRQSY